MLRQGWLAVLLALMLCMIFAGWIRAAEPIKIHIQSEISEAASQIEHFNSIKQLFLDQEELLQERLSQILASHKVEHIFVETPSEADITITLEMDYDEELYIFYDSEVKAHSQLRLPSLILLSDYPDSSSYIVDFGAMFPGAWVSAPAAMIFYLIGDCEQTEYYYAVSLQEFREMEDASEGGGNAEVKAHLGFYAANCFLSEGSFDIGETIYVESVELLKNNELNDAPLASIAVNLAWTRFQMGEVFKAFSTLNNAFSTEQAVEQNILILFARSQLHALNFDYDAALADMNTALELDPDNPELYVQRGQVYLLLYEWDRVMEDYNFALELDPEYADAYYYRGLLYYTTLVDRQNALPDFERYLELAPNGEHAEDAQNYADAIRAELKALER